MENETGAYSDTITLDTLPPSPNAITLAGGMTAVSTATISVELFSPDAVTYSLTGNMSPEVTGAAMVADTTVTLTSGDGSKTVMATYWDIAGNSASVTDAINLDTTPPVLTSVTLAGGAAAVSQATVAIVVSASADAFEVRVTGDVVDNGWLAFGVLANVTLTAGDGNKVVWAQVRDVFGNTSAPLSDMVVLDTTPPSLTSVVVASGAPAVSTTTVDVATTAGADAYELLITGDVVDWNWQPFAALTSATLLAGGGLKIVFVQIRDDLGNVSDAISDTVVLDTSPPVLASVTLAGGAAEVSNSTVNLAVVAGADAFQMRVTGDTDVADSGWIAFIASQSVTLLAGDGTKVVWVSVRDTLGNVSNPLSDTIVLDATPPVLAITTPTDGALLASLPNPILGTATDALAGITEVEISIFDGTFYWDGAGFDALVEMFFTATGAANWSLSEGLVGDDGDYTITARGQDIVGNAAITSIALTLDQTAPSCVTCVAISAPRYPWTNVQTVALDLDAADLHGPLEMKLTGDIEDAIVGVWIAFASTTDVTLTAGDGSKTVSVQYRDVLENETGTFGDTITLDTLLPSPNAVTLAGGMTAVSTATISVELFSPDAVTYSLTGNMSPEVTGAAMVADTTVTLTSGDGSKTVMATYWDIAGNSASVTDAIDLDTTAPVLTSVTLAGGADAVSHTTVGISISAGVDAFEVRVTGDVADSGWLATGALANVTLLVGDGTKVVWVRVRDVLQNTSVPVSDTVILDTTPPVLTSIELAGGADVVSTTTVNLATVAGADAAEMLVTGTVDLFGWQPFAASRTVTLTTLNAANTVYVKVRDSLGNTGGALSDMVVHDNTPPTGTIASLLDYTNGTTTTLELSASDINGPIEMRLTGDLTGGFVGQWMALVGVTTVTLTAGDGVKQVNVDYRDIALNVSAQYQATVTVDTGSPAIAVTTPADGALVSLIPNPIRGSVVDGETNVTAVTLSVFDGTMYWDGGGFDALVEVELVATGTDAWSLAGIVGGDDGEYTIRGYAWDRVGNQGMTVSTLTLDQTAPSCVTCIAIDAPRYPWTNATVVNAQFDASDLHLPIQMRVTGDVSDGFAGSWMAFASSMSLTLTLGDGPKSVFVSYRDAALNQSGAYVDQITLDTVPPGPSAITLAGGATTAFTQNVVADLFSPQAVTYNLSGSLDPLVFGAAMSPSKNIFLTAGEGVKTVFATYFDLAGNADTVSDVIEFNAVPVLNSAILASGSAYANRVTVALGTVASADAYELRVTGDVSAPVGWVPYQSLRAVTLTTGTGLKTAWVQVRDFVTLASNLVSDTVYYDPASVATLVLAGGAGVVSTTTISAALYAPQAVTYNLTGALSPPVLGAALVPLTTITLTAGDGAKLLTANYFDALDSFQTATDSIDLDTQPPVNDRWLQLAAGANHACGIALDRSLWCWGDNTNGQLGDGTTTQRTVPTEVSGAATDWVSVAAGVSHTCALKTNGRLYCWGYNLYGQLGDGITTQRTVPTQVSGVATDWQSVVAGVSHTCALKTNGRLYCWGSNVFGRLGDGTTTSKAVPTEVSGGATDWLSVAAGGEHTCAVKTNGRLYCWGYNGDGQLGDGTTTNRTVPTQVSGAATDWVSVAAGGDYTCAVKTNGRLYCWGWNFYGQLGDGTTTQRTVPTEVSGAATDWVSVAAGAFHTCAVKTNGRLYCWGSNGSGRLGDGTTTSKAVPTEVSGGATDWLSVVAGEAHTCAVKTNGRLYCWGYNVYGRLGDGTTTDKLTPTQVSGAATDWLSVAAGGEYTCAVKTTGRLYCWGRNLFGQLGDGTTTNRTVPTQVSGAATDWLSVAAGGRHTCALKTNGRLYCWGWNFYGQLGDGGGPVLAPAKAVVYATALTPPFYSNASTVSIAIGYFRDAYPPIEFQLAGQITDVIDWQPFASQGTVHVTAGDGIKEIQVRFRDIVQNTSGYYSAWITYDTTPPSLVNVLKPYDGQITTAIPTAITGQVIDALAGPDYTKVSLFDGTMYWDGTSFNALAAIEFDAIAGTPWLWQQNVNTAATDADYTIAVRAIDKAGNETSITSNFTKDATPPSCAACLIVDILRYPYTNQATVNLDFDATDPHGPMQMRLTGDLQDTIAGQWIAYTATTDVTLTNGDGDKTINVEFRDVLNNTTTIYSDTITLDTIPPAPVAITLAGGADFPASADVALELYSPQAISAFVTGDLVGGPLNLALSDYLMTNITLIGGLGPRTVTAAFYDAAGNVSEAADTVTLTATDPPAYVSAESWPKHGDLLSLTESFAPGNQLNPAVFTFDSADLDENAVTVSVTFAGSPLSAPADYTVDRTQNRQIRVTIGWPLPGTHSQDGDPLRFELINIRDTNANVGADVTVEVTYDDQAPNLWWQGMGNGIDARVIYLANETITSTAGQPVAFIHDATGMPVTVEPDGIDYNGQGYLSVNKPDDLYFFVPRDLLIDGDDYTVSATSFTDLAGNAAIGATVIDFTACCASFGGNSLDLLLAIEFADRPTVDTTFAIDLTAIVNDAFLAPYALAGRNDDFRVILDIEVAPASSETQLRLSGPFDQEVSATYQTTTKTNDTLIFSFADADTTFTWQAGAVYRLWVRAWDVTGNTSHWFNLSFPIQTSSSDTTAPTLTARGGERSGVNGIDPLLRPGEALLFGFSEQLDFRDMKSPAIQIVDGLGARMDVALQGEDDAWRTRAVDANGLPLLLAPGSYDLEYTNLADISLNENMLSGSFPFAVSPVTTTAPKLLFASPPSGTTNFNTNGRLELTFDAPMFTGSLRDTGPAAGRGGLLLEGWGNGWIPRKGLVVDRFGSLDEVAVWSVSLRSSSWRFETAYQLRLLDGLTNIDGIGLAVASPRVVAFSTAATDATDTTPGFDWLELRTEVVPEGAVSFGGEPLWNAIGISFNLRDPNAGDQWWARFSNSALGDVMRGPLLSTEFSDDLTGADFTTLVDPGVWNTIVLSVTDATGNEVTALTATHIFDTALTLTAAPNVALGPNGPGSYEITGTVADTAQAAEIASIVVAIVVVDESMSPPMVVDIAYIAMAQVQRNGDGTIDYAHTMAADRALPPLTPPYAYRAGAILQAKTGIARSGGVSQLFTFGGVGFSP